MESERKIIYSIINTVKRQANDDFEISERLLRGYLSDYRSEMINDYSDKGLTVSEECFQDLGEVPFINASGFTNNFNPAHLEFVADLPKIVRLKDNMGLILEKNGYMFPIVTSEEYNLSRTSIINKYIPKAKFLGKKCTVHIGDKPSECKHYDGLEALYQDFYNDYIDSSIPIKQIYIEVKAILDNPDDAPGYDWNRDPYPFPSELIEQMKTDILRKEFNIIVSLPNDKVTDGNARDTA